MKVAARHWSSAPPAHRAFLDRAIPALLADDRVVGVGGGGSLLTQTLDEHSDLDLVVALEDATHEQAMRERRSIAAPLGALVASFTGEHVGEPRLLICLFDEPLLHVDLKFVTLGELADRVEDPRVLGDRDGRFAAALAVRPAAAPRVDVAWLAERFWIWIHYGIEKARRGEVFECLDMLAFLRQQVLGPLAIAASGGERLPGQGLRRIERAAPAWIGRLEACLGGPDKGACLRALASAAALYAALRPDRAVGPGELAVRRHLDAVLGPLGDC